MKQIIVTVFVILVLALPSVAAHGEETFAEAEEIIKAKMPCDELSDEQLEAVGDYYMEQMHPGEAHEAMDEVMGGEGSESLRQMHISMARSFYCGEHDAISPGMMSMMMGRGGGMAEADMMGFGSGMSGYGYGGYAFLTPLLLVLLIVLIGIAVVVLLRQLQPETKRKH